MKLEKNYQMIDVELTTVKPAPQPDQCGAG